LFGLGDELNEDAMLGKLEGMKDVIEQVNEQFKDPVRLPVCIEVEMFLYILIK
jgi:arsenite/tail-anchored protein-transporting ATPase